MNITITGAGSLLGARLRHTLADEHTIRTVEGDIRDPVEARRAVDGAHAVLHLLPHTPPAGIAPHETVDLCTRGTYVLLTAAAAAGVERVVLASTLDVMEAYPPGWRVLESWRPRPSSVLHELAPYVAELSAREVAQDSSLPVICLRFGRLVDDRHVHEHAPDPRWLHVEDAVQAVQRALAFRPARSPAALRGWWVFHISCGDGARFPLAAAAEPAFGFAPQHRFGGRPVLPETRSAIVDDRGVLVPAHPISSVAPRPAQRVAVFGASGPLAAAAQGPLAAACTLRLTDVLSPENGAARIAARFPGAYLPQPPVPPHEFRRVDITQPDEVRDASRDASALLNCTVVREHLDGAFLVNTVGAYNVMRAAVSHSIRRVIHTGPQVLNFGHPSGYGADFDIPDEAPIRAGAHLYFHTKYLGLEICRVFAQNHGLEVAALLFSTFVNPSQPGRRRGQLGPAAVSWTDAGVAVRRAIDIPALPSPFEVLRILGDLPHGKFTNAKAKRVLGWQPVDSLVHLWQTDSETMPRSPAK
ncbi:MAG: NAD(P)-dependent oxidoreductase [Chloroflexi bacterium]|nr:NAD(P)-dependent oxidoreductase [Chloroflexota bacterium]